VLLLVRGIAAYLFTFAVLAGMRWLAPSLEMPKWVPIASGTVVLAVVLALGADRKAQ
jgi:hypothetical protein